MEEVQVELCSEEMVIEPVVPVMEGKERVDGKGVPRQGFTGCGPLNAG